MKFHINTKPSHDCSKNNAESKFQHFGFLLLKNNYILFINAYGVSLSYICIVYHSDVKHLSLHTSEFNIGILSLITIKPLHLYRHKTHLYKVVKVLQKIFFFILIILIKVSNSLLY